MNGYITFEEIPEYKNSIVYEEVWGENEQTALKIIPYLDTPLIHDTYIYPSGESSGRTHLINFLRLCSIKQLKEQKEVFIKNKDTLSFQGLLFLTPIYRNLTSKIKLLLQWGFNPNIQLKDTPYASILDKLDASAKPLHSLDNLSDIKVFIQHGADIHAKTIFYPFAHAFYKATNIAEIKKVKDLKEFVDFSKYQCPIHLRTTIDFIVSCENFKFPQNLLNPKTWYVEHINEQLKISRQPLTLYQLAQIEGQKSKILYLKQFEDTLEVRRQEETQYQTIVQQLHPDKKYKLLIDAIKCDNSVVLEHLSSFNLTHRHSGYNLLHKSIALNNKRFMEKIVQDKLLSTSLCSYINYAYDNKKTQPFLYLYEKCKNEPEFKSTIDTIVQKINTKMETLQKFNTDREIMSLLPTTIIYFLTKEGYYFNNSIVIERIAKMEKSALDSILQNTPIEKKSFKL